MKSQPITIYLPDTRGVSISRFGLGNLKLGPSVFSYSRPAGKFSSALNPVGTCPGATEECEAICYAKRIIGVVKDVYRLNISEQVPAIPAEARLLRIHVSGDFDTPGYIMNWHDRLLHRPDVIAWAYTRSWRVPALLPFLEDLRALPNVQLFASMDPSCEDMPPAGWRRAWIHRSFDNALETGRPMEERLMWFGAENQACITDGTPSYVCPEETGRKPDCESCRYCFVGQRNDVTFLEH